MMIKSGLGTALPLFLLTLTTYAAGCEETFLLDGVSYPVPAHRCGERTRRSHLADEALLLGLPEEVCWDDYEIYLAPEAHAAFVRMEQAAAEDNIVLQVKSGYRSASYQRSILRRRLARGQEMSTILKYVAPPGYSEHETGQAVDFIWAPGFFGNSGAYRWLVGHAAAFGFTESLPRDETGETAWEPWHWMYRPPAER